MSSRASRDAAKAHFASLRAQNPIRIVEGNSGMQAAISQIAGALQVQGNGLAQMDILVAFLLERYRVRGALSHEELSSQINEFAKGILESQAAVEPPSPEPPQMLHGPDGSPISSPPYLGPPPNSASLIIP